MSACLPTVAFRPFRPSCPFPPARAASFAGCVHNVRAGLFAVILIATPAYAGGHQHLERWYADALAAQTGARTEVRMGDGTRCDVLTATHAVEVEFAAKWCEAVGQSLNYASQTGRPGAIALIMECEGDARFQRRLRALIAWHRLPLVVVVLRPLNKTGIAFENVNAVSRP